MQRRQCCCDLLKNIYLCGSNNNHTYSTCCLSFVVICLKISIFVVATTTKEDKEDARFML